MDAVKIYENAVRRLEKSEITLGDFEKLIEPLRNVSVKDAGKSIMNDYIIIDRQVVLDAINIGLSGYITDDDKLFLEGMGLAVSGMPGELTCDGCTYEKTSHDLCGYCCRGYDDYYEEKA